MNNNYRYQLESPKVTGRRQQKTTCPQCGRRKCFVRYVDTHNDCRYVADDVGKCDHQHSCGYHYRPSEYYHDHPWAADLQAQDATAAPATARRPWTPPPLPPFQPLPYDYVTRSHSAQSTFWQWLQNEAAPRLSVSTDALGRLFDDYRLGATRQGYVIFWQIDRQQRVHGGHIMQYGPDGHRCGYQGWTHAKLMRQGLLPPDWQLHQCLFGEHLLPQRPDDRVCLVESEKTALLMALVRPQELWLATSGSGGLSPERTEALQGRRVTLFPDSGCYAKWLRQMQLTKGIDYNVSERLEAYPPNTDLADLLLAPT